MATETSLSTTASPQAEPSWFGFIEQHGHASICGKGQIGEAGFHALLHDPRLADKPFIIEVPGSGEGPDKENMDELRRLAA